jgi:hypothetical protein
VSRRKADQLIGRMVAVHTPNGIEVRWLSFKDETYVLHSIHGQVARFLHPHGENSIVGLVRWVGDAHDVTPVKKMARSRKVRKP